VGSGGPLRRAWGIRLALVQTLSEDLAELMLTPRQRRLVHFQIYTQCYLGGYDMINHVTKVTGFSESKAIANQAWTGP
jgi:hypothetical protein